jgi:hypothetical protein
VFWSDRTPHHKPAYFSFLAPLEKCFGPHFFGVLSLLQISAKSFPSDVPEDFASTFPLPNCNISPATMDSIIESRELQIERKIFAIDLRENGRGKFLRITEESQGHRNVIIVPISGVDDFADAIDDVLAAEPAA